MRQHIPRKKVVSGSAVLDLPWEEVLVRFTLRVNSSLRISEFTLHKLKWLVE